MTTYFIPKVWHAFESLKEAESDKVSRSKLKVFTQSIASVLNQIEVLPEFDTTFPDEQYKERGGVTFDEYENFLATQILTRLPQGTDQPPILDHELIDHDGAIAEGDEKEKEKDDKKKGGSLSKKKSVKQPSKTAAAAAAASSASTGVQGGPLLYLGSPTNIDWNKVDDLCWLLYKKRFFPTMPEGLTDNSVFIFWKLFTTYAKTVPGAGVIGIPVVMDGSELEFWMSRLNAIFALDYSRRQTVGETPDLLTFPHAVERLQDLLAANRASATEIVMAMAELEEEALEGVLKKGLLNNMKGKQGKSRWCILTTRTFKFFSDEEKLELKGQIPIRPNMKVESAYDKSERIMRFQITCDDRNYIFEASDMRSRNQWIQDFQTAIRHRSDDVDNWSIRKGIERRDQRELNRDYRKLERQQRDAELEKMREARVCAEVSLEENKRRMEALLRRKEDDAEKERKEKQRLSNQFEVVKRTLEKQVEELISEKQKEYESHTHTLKSMEEQMNDIHKQLLKTKEENEGEQKNRLQLEHQLGEEQSKLEAERNRIAQLEEIRDKLQRALEEEKQARKDEEVVRILQAKLLDEETEAKAKLQQLHEEQEKLLTGEISRRAQLECDLSNQKDDIEKIVQEKEDLGKKLEFVNGVAENLKKTLATIEDQLQTAEKQIRDLNEVHQNDLKTYNEEKARVHKETQNRYKQLEREIEDLNFVNSRMKEITNMLKNDYEDNLAKLEEATKSREILDKEMANLKVQLATEEEHLKKQKEIYEQLEKRLEDEKKERENEKSHYEAKLKAECDARKLLEDDQNEQVSYLSGEIEKRALLEMEVSDTRNKISRLQKENESLSVKLQDKVQLEHQLKEEQSKLEAERNRLAQLEEIRDKLQRALEEEKQARKDEEVVIRSQKEEIENVLKEKEELGKKFESREVVLDNENATLKDQLTAEKEHVIKQMESCGQLQKRLEEEKKERENEKTSFEAKLKAEYDIRKRLEDDQSEQVSYLSGEIEKRALLEIEVSDTRNKLSRLQREYEGLSVKLQEALTRVASLEAGHPSESSHDTTPEQPHDPHQQEAQHEQHTPSGPSTPGTDTGAKQGWASKFNLPFGSKNK